jgi:nucleoside-diphosphate-sugar epimerase
MLLNTGHTVYGVDNMNQAYDVRMKEYRLQKLQAFQDFHFEPFDISQPSILNEFKGIEFDAVFNLAARAGVRQSIENPWVYMETNLTGTLNLLELCRKNHIRKFILASTSSVYGADAPLPTPETATSDHPIQAYAASKKSAEVLCHAYHHLYGTDVTVFRYFTVFGPAGRPDMSMFRFVKWISEGQPVLLFGDGEQTRGFTYLDDIARGTILGLKPLGYEVINLGGHESVKINHLIRMFENLIGKASVVTHLPAHPADMLANWADCTKARQILGWEPEFSLLDGISRLVTWYNAERTWAKEISTH